MHVFLKVEYLLSQIFMTRDTSEVLKFFNFKNICTDFASRPPPFHGSEDGHFAKPETF